MEKKSKSTKQARKNQNLLIGIALALILLVMGSVAVLPRLNSGVGNDAAGLTENREVGVEEAYQLYQDGVYTLDVRTAEEYQEGHIPDSVLIPLNELASRAGELPEGEPILIYCRSGNRSLQALNMLEGAGFTNLSSMAGGFNEWVVAGYPAEQ